MENEFQSTLPLRGATNMLEYKLAWQGISIHAPLAGSDIVRSKDDPADLIFQSTLPLRGATGEKTALSTD